MHFQNAPGQFLEPDYIPCHAQREEEGRWCNHQKVGRSLLLGTANKLTRLMQTGFSKFLQQKLKCNISRRLIFVQLVTDEPLSLLRRHLTRLKKAAAASLPFPSSASSSLFPSSLLVIHDTGETERKRGKFGALNDDARFDEVSFTGAAILRNFPLARVLPFNRVVALNKNLL